MISNKIYGYISIMDTEDTSITERVSHTDSSRTGCLTFTFPLFSCYDSEEKLICFKLVGTKYILVKLLMKEMCFIDSWYSSFCCKSSSQ